MGVFSQTAKDISSILSQSPKRGALAFQQDMKQASQALGDEARKQKQIELQLKAKQEATKTQMDLYKFQSNLQLQKQKELMKYKQDSIKTRVDAWDKKRKQDLEFFKTQQAQRVDGGAMSLPSGDVGDAEGKPITQDQPLRQFGSLQGQRQDTSQEKWIMNRMTGKLEPNPDYISPLQRQKESREQLKFQQKQQEDKIEQVQKKELEQRKLSEERGFAQDMLETIGEVEKGIKHFGVVGDLPPYPGQFDKVNWRANYDKLISKRVLEVMSNLKKQSKTGATGFGQLSEKELAVLMNASTALKRNMSEKDAKKYLNKMKTSLNKILDTGFQKAVTPDGQEFTYRRR